MRSLPDLLCLTHSASLCLHTSHNQLLRYVTTRSTQLNSLACDHAAGPVGGGNALANYYGRAYDMDTAEFAKQRLIDDYAYGRVRVSIN